MEEVPVTRHSPPPQQGTGRGLGRLVQRPTTEPWIPQHARGPRAWLRGKARTGALVPGTHPRPRQPSLRLTSLCSSPSNKERSSGEKESGSSTAWREK